MASVCDGLQSRATPGRAFSRMPVREARSPDAGSWIAICIQRPTGDDIEQLLREIPLKTLNPFHSETRRPMHVGLSGTVGIARDTHRLTSGENWMPSRAWQSKHQ